MSALHDKICAVTGASSGIGQAVAQALAEAGARVLGYARRFTQKRLTFLPGPGEIREIQLDVTDEDAVAARFAELPMGLDVLVNAAGLGHFGWLSETDSKTLRHLLEVHVMGTFLCSREAWRSMQARDSGHIVCIGSVAAARYLPGCAAYTAAKAAQAALMRALAEEACDTGIRVTHILAGATDTPLWDGHEDVDRTRMMPPAALAAMIVDVLSHPELAIDELTILPPSGAL
jgi:3-oxoacyl-[acyl-carrier protein] reductase